MSSMHDILMAQCDTGADGIVIIEMTVHVQFLR